MNKPHKHAEILRAIADGVPIQIKAPGSCQIWEDWKMGINWSPLSDHNCVYRIKPEPPKYPQTRMTDSELLYYIPGDMHPYIKYAEIIANVAIERAITDGDVVPTAMLEKVASAVMFECQSRMTNFFEREAFVATVNLDSIIASVTEQK